MKNKKMIIAIIIVIVAVIATVVILQSNNSKEPQTTTTTEQTAEQSATPLTEDEIKALFLKAHELYFDWLSSANSIDADWDKTTTINGVEYFTVNSTEITSVDALKAEFAKFFGKEVYDNQIDNLYVMNNGKMYGNAVLVEGGDILWQNHKLTVKTNTSTECTLTITSYFEGEERRLDYKLKVIDGEWKFTDVFNCVTIEELKFQ